MSSEVGLFWLLLPLSAAVTWYLARRGSERVSGIRVHRLSKTYFRGLNYLLNEQPDKAIEIFLQIAEVNNDSVETHLALGNLFRRRGEVDRAIRLHQNLIARPNLNPEQKTVALLELGEDYMRAGLLDRAEILFSDLIGLDTLAPSALRHLISIYQQERDWSKAIDHARRWEQATGESMAGVIAQFHCELAEEARARGDVPRARECVGEAFRAEPGCVRARLIEGNLEREVGDDLAAVKAFERAASEDVEYVPELLEPMIESARRAGELPRVRRFLADVISRYKGISPVLALAGLIEEEQGEGAAAEFLTEQLRRRPSVRGLDALIDLSLVHADGTARDTLSMLRELTRKLLEGKSSYRCGRCGFGARSHHWQCPSCKTWSSVKPIHGVVGE